MTKIQKGMLCEVKRVDLADRGLVYKLGDRMIVVDDPLPKDSLACEVYNQRTQKKHWIWKNRLKVLSK